MLCSLFYLIRKVPILKDFTRGCQAARAFRLRRSTIRLAVISISIFALAAFFPESRAEDAPSSPAEIIELLHLGKVQSAQERIRLLNPSAETTALTGELEYREGKDRKSTRLNSSH